MEEEEDHWSQSRRLRDNATMNLISQRLGNIDIRTHTGPTLLSGYHLREGKTVGAGMQNCCFFYFGRGKGWHLRVLRKVGTPC